MLVIDSRKDARAASAGGILVGRLMKRGCAGIVTDDRMKKTFDMMVAYKLVDPAKVDVKKTYTTQFVKDIKVLP